MIFLVAIVLASMVACSQQLAITPVYRDGGCSANAFINCDSYASCVESADGKQFTCQCQANSTGDGFKTTVGGTGCTLNYKPCATSKDCPQYGTCSSTYRCVCNKGFEGDGFTCTDINECPSPLCDPHAFCQNFPGGFKCVCDINNHFVGDGFNCTFKCGSNNDCDAPRAVCDDQNKCVCIKGYEGDGRKCTDVDECALKTLNNCNANATCINTAGSFKCECKNGFVGNGLTCTSLPKSCKDIANFVNNKTYRIDPDFTGPAKSFNVICDKVGTTVVTKLPATGPFPMAIPDKPGELVISYEPQPTDIQAMLENFFFCYQDISVTCNAGFSLLPGLQWTDAYGNTYNSFGSSVDGQCACGELAMCTTPTSACNCDGNQTSIAIDTGRLVDKQKMPLTKLIITKDFTNKGRIDIQPLICADKPVGLPKDCFEAKGTYGMKKNSIIYIKPDVNGPLPPFQVFCDVETFFHAGITVIPVMNPQVILTDSSTVNINYPVDYIKMQALITASKYCAQNVSYTCKNSKLMAGGGYVSVTSANRKLNYFPGANGVPGVCACGATQSCVSPSVKCNCDIGDDIERQDFGVIINKTDLPIYATTGEFGIGKKSVYQIGHLLCSQWQFGIQPNCDKARSDGVKQDYTYLIDPDGPLGTTAPFPAHCAFTFNPPQGATIIHHSSEGQRSITDLIWEITYLQASKAQISALQLRSTFCTQEVKVQCQQVNIQDSSGTITFLGPNKIPQNLTDFFDTCGPNKNRCNCNGQGSSYDTGVITDMRILPINSLDFSNLKNSVSGLTISVGPMICSETFTTCAQLQDFLVSNRTALGESYLATGSFTIDPDGPGSVQPFEVRCTYSTTTVIISPNNASLDTDPNNPVPISKCFDISYSTYGGSKISPAQISALVKRSGKCSQSLTVECKYAPVSGRINYTSCDGTPQIGWAGSYKQDKCACGVNGICTGGTYAKCNCDMGDSVTRSDTGTIINADSLPVCQVCFSITPIPGKNGQPGPVSYLKYKIGELVCDGGQGTYPSCQDARKIYGTTVKSDFDVLIPSSTDPPIPMGCRLWPNPPVGVLAVRAGNYLNPTNQTIDILINYVTFNLTLIRDLMSQNEYCSQNIYLFCASEASLKLGGQYGWYSYRGEISYEWQQIPDSNDAITTVCTKNKALCTQCGRPKGFALTKDTNLPVSRLVLAGGGATIVIGDAECLNIKKTCHEIMFVKDRKQGYVSGKQFIIDPDGNGILKPFVANCEFDDVNTNGVTEIPVVGNWTGPIHVIDKVGVDTFEIPITYDQATPDQCHALTQVSEFCWQSMKYECSYSPIHQNNQTTSYYKLFNTNKQGSFGTGEDVNAIGCACSQTGTCTPGYSCNCDAVGKMAVDQGAVTNTQYLPLTSVSVGGQMKGTSYADVRVTNLRCSPQPIDPPRDCQDALKRKSLYGVNYTVSSEYLISPAPGQVKPFMVRCDFDISKGNGVTIIRPNVPPKTPLVYNPDNPIDFPYYAPTVEQIVAVVDRSPYCYQAIKVDCRASTLLSEGNYWMSPLSREKHQFWGGGEVGTDGRGGVCACGKHMSCGGLDSATGQRTRACNCDAADDQYRSDAGYLDVKQFLPLKKFQFARDVKFKDMNITLGDLMCSEIPLSFNECDTGFNDCHPQATCIDEEPDYRCVCKEGWNGLGIPLLSRNPRSNGRECIDDNECAAYEPCPYSATCTNIPGDFYCTCKEGYRQTGKTSCEDIDECASSDLNDCDDHARCENLDGTYRCKCERGYRGDGFTCIPVGECSCFGDTHCISYDNRWLHFMGTCEYVMTQDGCQPGTRPTFRVLVEQWKKNNTLPGYYSWIKSVRIQIFSKEIILQQNNRMLVDGIAVKQFFDEHRLSAISYNNYVTVQTVTGLEVTWDFKDAIQVTVPEDSANKLCGLCGNYNDQAPDDWQLGPACPAVHGQQTDNEDLFGRSWTVLQRSTVACTVDCNDTKQPEPTCNHPMAVVEKECDKLLNTITSPFRNCLMLKKQSDVDELRKSCNIDLCHTEDNFDEDICKYAQYLNDDCVNNEKVEINDWKKEVSACTKTKCSNNMIFKECGPTFVETCIETVESDLTRVNDTKGCSEGCFCEEGLVMEGDRCIKREQCGCFYNNGYMATRDVVILPDCSHQIKCLGKNVTSESPVICKENEECSTQDGVTGCYCQEGFSMKPGQTRCTIDTCTGVVCDIPNMECVNGTCECKMGFIGDCNQCEDIDECATGLHTCKMVGQTCINLDGSFKCGCQEGFIISGNICKDIDECDYGIDNCGNHSECVNTVGGFLCECCVGYKKDASGQCVRDTSTATLPDNKCCACQGEKCNDTGKVCGSDGVTYSNYRSLSITACKSGNTDLKVEYKGACQGTCATVICEKQYSNCSVVDGKPTCSCPKCEDSSATFTDQTVCATNKITYTSICHMKQATCEADFETKVEVETVGKPCPGNGQDPTGPWSDWGDCSEKCKQGTRNRTREVYVENKDKKIHDTEFIPCYNTCPNGPCTQETCVEPGQVCVADDNNNPSCQCPTCEMFEPKPICTRVLNVIKTYENECELEKAICETKTDDYEILEPRACEDKPVKCGLIRDYRIETINGCTADRHINFGACYGGCDDEAELCCVADKTGSARANLYCPDRTHFGHTFETVVGCSCVPKPGDNQK